MAFSRRQGWDQLSPGYRARLVRSGITRAGYERGQSLQYARGHLETPEHGKKQAERNPVRYRKYLAKKTPPKGKTPEQQARELNTVKDRAYQNEHQQLHLLLQYNDDNVRARIYGGIDSEGTEHEGMSLYEANWTAKATMDQLRSRARPQDEYNPWWYH